MWLVPVLVGLWFAVSVLGLIRIALDVEYWLHHPRQRDLPKPPARRQP